MITNIHLNINGTEVSIAVGKSAYCSPREDGHPAYTAVELGLWTEPLLGELKDYADGSIQPTGSLTVYGYVPVELLIRELHSLLNK